jgi:H+/Cl- antiporter ClcA
VVAASAAASSSDQHDGAREGRVYGDAGFPLDTSTPSSPDPLALLRSREYAQLLVLAGLIGVPVSAAAYGFLKLVAVLQDAFFDRIPDALGLDPVPTWWPLPVLALSGLLVALAIGRLPGSGGHSPADGFKASGPLPPVELAGVLLAALATLSFGVVLGPEGPLILMGSGLGVLAVRLAARDAPPTAAAVLAAAGSFAAISALLGSPLLGAFLLLEASGLGGPMLGLVLMPGLLAAGIGSLIFLGLGSLTGFGTLSLAIPALPPFDHLTVAMFGYALAFGLAAPFLARAIHLLALDVRPHVERRMTVLMPLLGLIIAGLAIAFAEATGKATSMVLFSGQDQLGPLLTQAAGWSVGSVLLLLACKGLAYAVSLSSFRGGPVFPAMFLGAAAGVAASHLPGLPLVPAAAMGIGAMCCAMLTLPLTSTLLATLLLGADGVQAMPLVIVAVVVAYVVTARLTPAAQAATDATPQARGHAATAAVQQAGATTSSTGPRSHET